MSTGRGERSTESLCLSHKKESVTVPSPPRGAIIKAMEGARKHMNEEQIQALYMDTLAEEGFRPKIDEDGDIIFKSEGRSLYIRLYADDTEYMQLVMPNFWKIESDEERVCATIAANHATRVTKVTKVFVTKENTCASIEMFLPSPDLFAKVINRSVAALRNGAEHFVEKMKEMEHKEEDEPSEFGESED